MILPGSERYQRRRPLPRAHPDGQPRLRLRPGARGGQRTGYGYGPRSRHHLRVLAAPQGDAAVGVRREGAAVDAGFSGHTTTDPEERYNASGDASAAAWIAPGPYRGTAARALLCSEKPPQGRPSPEARGAERRSRRLIQSRTCGRCSTRRVSSLASGGIFLVASKFGLPGGESSEGVTGLAKERGVFYAVYDRRPGAGSRARWGRR